MKYVCGFCGLTSEDLEKVLRCEAKGSGARYFAGQEVVFLCPVLGVMLELKGIIREIKHKSRTHEVFYRIFVGEDSRLKHQNCVYGGIRGGHVIRKY